MDERKYIVFGRNLGNSLGQIRSVGETGKKCIVVWVGDDLHFPSTSKYVEKIHFVASYEDGLNLIIDKYSYTNNKSFIFADNDASAVIIDENYDKLKDKFIFWNSEGHLRYYMTKHIQCELASKMGLRCPKTECVKVGELPKNLRYPIFSKATDSFDTNWKSTVSICANEQELVEMYKRCSSDTIILQEYVEKENEYIIEGLSINNGSNVFFPIDGSYYRLPKDAYGSFVHMHKFIGEQSFIDKLVGLISDFHYSGIFEYEFLEGKDGELYFLEVNLRPSLFNHACSDMGYNLHKEWINAMLSGCINTFVPEKPNHILINEVTDFRRQVLSREESIFKWLKDFFVADSYILFDKHDIRPFITYVWSLIKRKIKF